MLDVGRLGVSVRSHRATIFAQPVQRLIEIICILIGRSTLLLRAAILFPGRHRASPRHVLRWREVDFLLDLYLQQLMVIIFESRHKLPDFGAVGSGICNRNGPLMRGVSYFPRG